MKLLISKFNWTEHTSEDWSEIKWTITDDLKVEIVEVYESGKNKIELCNISEYDYNEVMKNINIAKQSDIKEIEAYDGSSWEFVEYEGEQEVWKRNAGYIYGIRFFETITKILEKLKYQADGINLDRKELIEILKAFHQEIKNIKPDDIDKDVYLKFLKLLKEKLNSKEYISDTRFVTYCRRDFLRQEMADRLNQKVYTGINYLLEAFYDLEDYINNDTWISIGSVPDFQNSRKVIDDDTSYKNDGFICLEEKNILIDMIDEFINKLSLTEVKTENDDLNLCIALIYYYLATTPDENQTLNGVLKILKLRIIEENIDQFPDNHPAKIYYKKLSFLTTEKYNEILKILENKIEICRNYKIFDDELRNICSEKDVEKIAKHILKFNEQ